MRFGSLFAGLGAMDYGLESAGMECAWQVEIEPWCRQVLEKHWPTVRRHDDVRTFPPTAGDWSCDLIAGGFPCQDISVAGNRAGIQEGTRSGLWIEYARIVRAIRPRYVLVENVAALLEWELGRVLGDLAALGYDAEWDCIPASSVGALHRRDRVFIVAHAIDIRMEGLGTRDDLGKARDAGERRWGKDRSMVVREIANTSSNRGARWPQPMLHGMDARPSDWVERTKGLGNAVQPAVAEFIGRRIMEHEKLRSMGYGVEKGGGSDLQVQGV